MTLIGWLQIGLLFLIVAILVKPLGLFMARVFAGERTFLSPVLGPIERGFYAAAGIDARAEQGWFTYALSMLAFSMAGFVALYAILRQRGFDDRGVATTPEAIPSRLRLTAALTFQ